MNERSIFLLDGVGAALSFVFTGLVLPHYSGILGMTKEVIYCLAAFPAMYMIFSFCCYRIVKVIRSWMLLITILANLVYCVVSGSLIVFYDGLTDLGQYLLSAEIIVVLVVVAFELKVYQPS